MHAPHRSKAVRTLALLGLCSWLVGCHKWVAMEEPYAESITAEQPDQIRVRTSNSEVELYGAQVVGDSILGQEKAGSSEMGAIYSQPTTTIPMAVALSDITSVDERVADELATGALVVGVIVGSFFAAVGIYSLTCTPGTIPCPRD